MKHYLSTLGVFAASMLAVATPAHATEFVTGSPASMTINHVGTIGTTVTSGLTAQQVLNFLGSAYNSATNQTVFSFDYQLTNTSGGNVTASRISNFGFSSDPLMASASSTGIFNNAVVSEDMNIPVFNFSADACFNSNGPENCSGGKGGGLTIGQSGGGTFNLSYAGNISSINLTDFFVRFQSIEGTGIARDASGVGIESAVPEPATWALMLIGFGAVGHSMRRGKKFRLQQAV